MALRRDGHQRGGQSEQVVGVGVDDGPHVHVATPWSRRISFSRGAHFGLTSCWIPVEALVYSSGKKTTVALLPAVTGRKTTPQASAVRSPAETRYRAVRHPGRVTLLGGWEVPTDRIWSRQRRVKKIGKMRRMFGMRVHRGGVSFIE